MVAHRLSEIEPAGSSEQQAQLSPVLPSYRRVTTVGEGSPLSAGVAEADTGGAARSLFLPSVRSGRDTHPAPLLQDLTTAWVWFLTHAPLHRI